MITTKVVLRRELMLRKLDSVRSLEKNYIYNWSTHGRLRVAQLKGHRLLKIIRIKYPRNKMTDLAFHVYDRDNKVVVHSLSVEELERKLEEGKISTAKHEIVPVWEPPYDEISQ